MIGKKILITAMSATLLLGSAAASFAANGHHMGGRQGPRMPPEVLFVRMLQQFDTNADMKISKDEATAGVDKIFDAIDTNKDGSVTPGEFREYRKAQMTAMREERKKMMEENKDKAKSDDQAMNDDEGGKPPRDGKDGPRGEGRHGKGMRGGMMAEMLFHRVDTDQNGQISKAEAEAAMAKLFDRMDRNHDGFIALDDMPKRPLL